jgi:hypothetical protein
VDCLAPLAPAGCTTSYGEALRAAIYDEAVRFDEAWRKRQPTLLPLERNYAEMKLARLQVLCASGEHFEFLLALMDLVEDAETLTERGQPEFPVKILAFRDHLREVLNSPLYADFKAGKREFFRDMISNLNGMYHVMTVNPDLLKEAPR